MFPAHGSISRLRTMVPFWAKARQKRNTKKDPVADIRRNSNIDHPSSDHSGIPQNYKCSLGAKNEAAIAAIQRIYPNYNESQVSTYKMLQFIVIGMIMPVRNMELVQMVDNTKIALFLKWIDGMKPNSSMQTKVRTRSKTNRGAIPIGHRGNTYQGTGARGGAHPTMRILRVSTVTIMSSGGCTRPWGTASVRCHRSTIRWHRSPMTLHRCNWSSIVSIRPWCSITPTGGEEGPPLSPPGTENVRGYNDGALEEWIQGWIAAIRDCESNAER